MNFLAHLVLAPQTPEGLIGSVAPDMIRGPLPKDLNQKVLASAREHRQVDRFTDAHNALKRTRQTLRSVVDSRLTGVLADVLYDHVLARDWTRWRDDALRDYLSQTEGRLTSALTYVPVRMQMIIRRMIDEQWLASYATTDGIRTRLDTMSQRLTLRVGRPMSLSISERQLADHTDSLTQDFEKLWPDLIAHVDRYRAEAKERLAN